MPSPTVTIQRIRRLLKTTSREMRRITSQPMPEPSSTYATPPSSKPSTEFEYHPSNWFTDPPQSEFSLSEDLLKAMEFIVICRQRTFAALSEIPPHDGRENRKNDVIKRIQEIETRAMVFLTLPPTSTGDWEDTSIADRVNYISARFLEDAESCLSDAKALLSGEIVTNETKSNCPPSILLHKPDLPKELLIPGFCQSDALKVNQENNNCFFQLLSNPDFRMATSLVKIIIGSACSQITGNDPEHCLNRLKYLLTFFDGAPVRPPGAVTETFRLPENMGLAFAWDCLLNAALAQAERQFAFSLHSSLPFAAVLATLLARYPEYISTFLARMALACPILTCYADHATSFPSLGEEVDESVLQSWRGIARLFAAVLVARPPPNYTQRPEYLNPKLLWITVAGIAREVDKFTAAAEVLHGLIEIGGYVLLRLYRNQAKRLFKSIIDSVGDPQSVSEIALVTCLEQLLDPATSVENGYGVLLDDFWN